MREKLTTVMVTMAWIFLAGLTFMVPVAHASIVDLSSSLSGTYFVTGSGVLFTNDINVVNVGTGNFDPFLTVQAQGNNTVEQGYNTSGRLPGNKAPFDADSTANREKDILLSGIHVVNIQGTDYYEFLVDINQSRGQDNALLSLDEVQIYLGANPNALVTDVNDLGTLGTSIYSLRDDTYQGESLEYALLNAGLTTGSGGGVVDVGMYVPVSFFAGSNNPYLYFYTKFGIENGANGGFEEWGTRAGSSPPAHTPEPASVALLGLGLALARMRKRSTK